MLIIRVINLELVQLICHGTSTSQTDRQTDGRTDGRPTISIPRIALHASRGKNWPGARAGSTRKKKMELAWTQAEKSWHYHQTSTIQWTSRGCRGREQPQNNWKEISSQKCVRQDSNRAGEGWSRQQKTEQDEHKCFVAEVSQATRYAKKVWEWSQADLPFCCRTPYSKVMSTSFVTLPTSRVTELVNSVSPRMYLQNAIIKHIMRCHARITWGQMANQD